MLRCTEAKFNASTEHPSQLGAPEVLFVISSNREVLLEYDETLCEQLVDIFTVTAAVAVTDT